MKTNRKLATRIVDRIMTNGSKQKAQRLVLELQHSRYGVSYGGGWSRLPLIDRITEILDGHETS